MQRQGEERAPGGTYLGRGRSPISGSSAALTSCSPCKEGLSCPAEKPTWSCPNRAKVRSWGKVWLMLTMAEENSAYRRVICGWGGGNGSSGEQRSGIRGLWAPQTQPRKLPPSCLDHRRVSVLASLPAPPPALLQSPPSPATWGLFGHKSTVPFQSSHSALPTKNGGHSPLPSRGGVPLPRTHT